MLFVIIAIGWILLRNAIPWLFYTIGIAFILFLAIGIFGSIKEGEFSVTEALYALAFAIIALYIMFC